jgi:hypothetical protein
MGLCGGGNQDPRADGTSEEWFRLIPRDATVRITVPETREDVVQQTAVRRRVIASCEGHQDETFDFSGNGVWVSFAGFSHVDMPQFVKSQITFRRRQDAAWRHRDPVDLGAFIQANHATSALVVIDMDSNGLLGGQQGAQSIRQNMIDVIRLAQAQNMRIFEVYCAGHRTHDTLITAMTQRADTTAYAHHRVFEKPGTGGACTAQCLELVTATPFTTAIGGLAHAIVMGFDASICAGKSIFGGWITDRVIAPDVVDNAIEVHTLAEHYERGLLDHGLQVITSWQVCICGNAGGPLSSAYLTYR